MKQYFTNKDTPDLSELRESEIPIVKLMANIVPILDDIYYIRMCEDIQKIEKIGFDYEYLASVDISFVTNHWNDFFECLSHSDQGNSLSRLLFLTFCKERDFTFLTCFTNGYDYKRYGINLAVGERHVDGYIKSWFYKELGLCNSDHNPSDDCDFEYGNEHIEMGAEVLIIKNKSVGRKLRKYYSSNEIIRKFFNELGYFMVNGQFVTVYWINLEYYDPLDGEYEISTLVDGVGEIRRELGTKQKNRNLENLVMLLSDMQNCFYEDTDYMAVIIGGLINIKNTEREIIL